MAKTPSKKDPQGLVSWHSSMGREGPGAPGPTWPWKRRCACRKIMSHSQSDAPQSIQGKEICKITFPKELPDLSMAPPQPWAFALTSRCCLILSARQCLFPPAPTTPPHLGKCSHVQHRSPLKLATCPLLRASVPARVCQPAGRHDFRPVCNMLQRCLFSSGGVESTEQLGYRDTQTRLMCSKNY